MLLEICWVRQLKHLERGESLHNHLNSIFPQPHLSVDCKWTDARPARAVRIKFFCKCSFSGNRRKTQDWKNLEASKEDIFAREWIPYCFSQTRASWKNSKLSRGGCLIILSWHNMVFFPFPAMQYNHFWNVRKHSIQLPTTVWELSIYFIYIITMHRIQ